MPVLGGAAARPDLIASGVTLAGIPVGGMSYEEAQAAVAPAFARPIELVYGGTHWRLNASRFGGEVSVADGVSRALDAGANTPVDLVPRVNASDVGSIVDMQRNPWWRPPTQDAWARGLKPVPPGPGNTLGTRWMGLSAAGVGIHGTPDDASVGYSASHGCIRMHIPDAEWLFEHVHVGTPVVIVG